MFGRGTLQTVFSGFAVEQGKQSRDRPCYTQLKAGRACGCLYDGWIGSRFILAMALELWRCNFAQLVVWRLHFTSHIFLRAGKAWPSSEHTESLLPDMLRAKSPCLGAESASGRPEDLGTRAISEAQVELWFWCFGPLQQQSHAVSVCKNANRTGLTLSMPSSNRCLAEAHFNRVFWIRSWAGQTIKRLIRAGALCSCTACWVLWHLGQLVKEKNRRAGRWSQTWSHIPICGHVTVTFPITYHPSSSTIVHIPLASSVTVHHQQQRRQEIVRS